MLLYTSELENQTTKLSNKLDLTTQSNNIRDSVLSESMLTNKTGNFGTYAKVMQDSNVVVLL